MHCSRDTLLKKFCLYKKQFQSTFGPVMWLAQFYWSNLDLVLVEFFTKKNDSPKKMSKKWKKTETNRKCPQFCQPELLQKMPFRNGQTIHFEISRGIHRCVSCKLFGFYFCSLVLFKNVQFLQNFFVVVKKVKFSSKKLVLVWFRTFLGFLSSPSACRTSGAGSF
jgi:hypothetical protein